MKKKLVFMFTTLALTTTMLSACASTTKTTDKSSNTTATANTKTDTTTPAAKATDSSKTAATAKAKTTDSSKTAATAKATGNVVNIKVGAKDFEYDKKVINVKQGDKVKITLHSADGGHGLAIPAYNVNIQGNGSAEFTANKKGTFEYHCSVECGSGHMNMTGKLIVS